MNMKYGRFGRIAKIAIATGALLLATSGCVMENSVYQKRFNAAGASTTKQQIAKNIEFLVNHAKENKSGQWKKDDLTLRMQECYFSYNNLYLCLTLKNGEFYSINYSGLRPYTSSSLTFFDESEDGPGFSDPEANIYEEKYKDGKMFLKINEKSSKESIDIANQAELMALEWIVKTQLK